MVRATFLLTGLLLLPTPLPAQDLVDTSKRSLGEIQKNLTEILAPAKNENEAALAKLKAYRYLAGIAYADLELDENYNKYAQAASKICDELGRLEHTPKNPGWPEEEFKIAYKGASSSNLGGGFPTLDRAVDGWMYDSDKFNIDRLGHRRWCLNPSMKKVGFGRTGKFTAMYCFDMSRVKVPPFEFVAWPPPGIMPPGFFREGEAWSVTFHPKKYQVPAKGVQPTIYDLKDGGEKGAALELSYTNVDFVPFAIPNCLVFRPAGLDRSKGRRYLVEIEGVRADGKETTIRYQVEFAGK